MPRPPAGIAHLSIPRRRPSYISNLFTPNAAPRLAVQQFSCGRTRQIPRFTDATPRSVSSTSAKPLWRPNQSLQGVKRTVQTVCVADCTVSVCAADGLEPSERAGSGESLRLYYKFSFLMKVFVAADLQTPLFLLSNKRVLASGSSFRPRLLRNLNVIVCNTAVTHLSQ